MKNGSPLSLVLRRAEFLAKEERAELECIEPRRWNAYMRACGYVYSGFKDAASRVGSN